LFEAPTVVELAARIEQRESPTDALEEVARYLAEVEALSEEEIERQLFKENAQTRETEKPATVKK
jgi:hypothetical protein